MVEKYWTSMIRVGFLINISSTWMGGLNYMKNLLYAINKYHNYEVELVLFISDDLPKELKDELSKYGEVVTVSFLNKRTFNWFIWKILKMITKSDFIVELFLRKYKIDIFSHSDLIGLLNAKTINWIADFQYMHLPNMFREKDINYRKKNDRKLSQKSDKIIVSSYDALNDYKNFIDSSEGKVNVLQFVSQPGIYLADDIKEFNKVKEKYHIKSEFFFLPNQFWKHKNHLVVLKALNLLKQRGINLTLVCTGHIDDFRNKEHVNSLIEYINNNQLNVFFLGLIEQKELMILFKYSIAVINPSFFEGWSSTVEECKSLGKNMILSNITVHKEQSPANSFYFNPNDELELSNLLEIHVLNPSKYMKLYNKDEFEDSIKYRTSNFAQNYMSILQNTL